MHQHVGEQRSLVTFDLLILKVVSESRVTMCANFGLPRPLRHRPDVRDRQTDKRQTASSLNAPAY